MISFFLLLPFLIQCSSLPNPSEGSRSEKTNREARSLVSRSAQTHGDPWSSYDEITASYDGKWARLVNRIQPDLVDAGFRKKSVETYDTRTGRVTQFHEANEGRKEVLRTRGGIKVRYVPAKEVSSSQNDASALVADAYTAFLFGPSWIKEHAAELSMLSPGRIDSAKCHRIQGTLRPGFGFSQSDDFIIWIDTQTNFCKRLQFTLNGLESTRGSDVSVTFSSFVRAKDGSIWPTKFVEYVERPIHLKAHEWQLLSLSADGRIFLSPQKAPHTNAQN